MTTNLRTKIGQFIFERLKAHAVIEDTGIDDQLIDQILTAKLMDFLGMKDEYGRWGLTYDHPNPAVIRLVMRAPGIREAIKALLENCFVSERFDQKMMERVAADEYKNCVTNGDRRNFYRYSWTEILERAVSAKRTVVYDAAIVELANEMARDDARTVFEQGSDAAIEQMNRNDVPSDHVGMERRSSKARKR